MAVKTACIKQLAITTATQRVLGATRWQTMAHKRVFSTSSRCCETAIARLQKLLATSPRFDGQRVAFGNTHLSAMTATKCHKMPKPSQRKVQSPHRHCPRQAPSGPGKLPQRFPLSDELFHLHSLHLPQNPTPQSLAMRSTWGSKAGSNGVYSNLMTK